MVRGLKNNLLGLPAIQHLSLIEKVDSTITTQKCLKDLVHWEKSTNPGATLFNTRCALLRMCLYHFGAGANGVHGLVSCPDPALPERRICVDLKPLNESVLREVHPIPSVDKTLGKLAGATVVTKLDVIERQVLANPIISEDSCLLTTYTCS